MTFPGVSSTCDRSLTTPYDSHFVKHYKPDETLIAFTQREGQPSRVKEPRRKLIDPVVIGARLKVTREVLGLDQRQLCIESEIGESAYNQYEKGNRPLTLTPAIKLCRRFGLTLDWLYRGDPSGLPQRIAGALWRFAEIDEAAPSPGFAEPRGAAAPRPRRAKGGRR